MPDSIQLITSDNESYDDDDDDEKQNKTKDETEKLSRKKFMTKMANPEIWSTCC